MTESEKNKLHNIFIKLKNDGKNLEEIKRQLKLDEVLIDEWNASFEIAKSTLPKGPEIKSAKISGIKDGRYARTITRKFEMSLLQRAIFDLQNILVNKNNDEGSVEKARKYLPIFENYFTEEKARKYLPIFENYFTEFAIEVVDDHQFNIEKTLNTNDPEIIKLADEAANFYAEMRYNRQASVEKVNLITKESEDKFKNSSDILDYSLKRLEVEKYEGIERLSIVELPVDTKWIFLIGENSYGKTTILKSIAIGLFGEKDEEVQLLKTSQIVSSEYNASGKSVINNISSNRFKKLNHLAFYGTSRLEIQSKDTKNDVTERSTTTYSLFKSNGVLLSIEYSLIIWSFKDSIKFNAVKAVFKKLIPYLEDIQITDHEEVLYIEKEPDENGEIYKPVSFNQLASGFRSIIAMVGDMMIRLFKSQPNISEPSELAGIVIIDELDLHLHPKIQREIPKLLSSIFPKVQFIASTHSLVPLLGAPENSVLLKVNRTKEVGITAEKVDIDFQALSTDTMLRDIFDLEKYMSDAKISAWERFKELTRLIKAEQILDIKESLMDERREIGNKYSFPI